jgi:hypothetical protein
MPATLYDEWEAVAHLEDEANDPDANTDKPF